MILLIVMDPTLPLVLLIVVPYLSCQCVAQSSIIDFDALLSVKEYNRESFRANVEADRY